jgi:hypothetical protein
MHLLLLLSALLADANTENRLREALRTATTQLQSLQDEQAQWQAKEAKLTKELEATREELAAAKRAPPKREGLSLAARKEYENKLATAAETLAHCQLESDAAHKSEQAKEEERAQLAASLGKSNARVAACGAKNEKLFRVGQDVLDWLQKMGTGAALAAREPFLGLKRVELENAAQDYEDKLLDQRVAPSK